MSQCFYSDQFDVFSLAYKCVKYSNVFFFFTSSYVMHRDLLIFLLRTFWQLKTKLENIKQTKTSKNSTHTHIHRKKKKTMKSENILNGSIQKRFKLISLWNFNRKWEKTREYHHYKFPNSCAINFHVRVRDSWSIFIFLFKTEQRNTLNDWRKTIFI